MAAVADVTANARDHREEPEPATSTKVVVAALAMHPIAQLNASKPLAP